MKRHRVDFSFGDSADDSFLVARDAIEEKRPDWEQRVAKIMAQVREQYPDATIPDDLGPWDPDWWAAFAEGAARAIWSDTYISEVEEFSQSDDTGDHEVYRELSPGSGGSWDSVVPEAVPEAADKQGKKFATRVRKTLKIEDQVEVASKLDAEQAGWYGMMQALGHGVGWFDYDIKIHHNINETANAGVYNAAYDAVTEALEEAGYERVPVQLEIDERNQPT
jgi:hypothetical protein